MSETLKDPRIADGMRAQMALLRRSIELPASPEEDEPALSICELTPITLPAPSNSGPPELPGLMAASV